MPDWEMFIFEIAFSSLAFMISKYNDDFIICQEQKEDILVKNQEENG